MASESKESEPIPPGTKANSKELETLANRLDEEPTARLPETGEGVNSGHDPVELTPCNDCHEAHMPRRVVCCVDGTLLTPDGVVGSEGENASNIFRIWASIKTGVVQDETGKSWYQIRKYYKGVGADLDLIPRIHSGITGSGFEVLIFKVYKFCALNCCPSRDEIYLFGFSRGAYVVRAVAALFQHMRTLDPRLAEFDNLYWASLSIYRGIRDKHEFRRHETYHHLVEHTLPPVPVKFIGVIDTVKAVDDAGLYDIEQTANIIHVRHTLAILEMRDAFSPEQYKRQKPVLGDETAMNEALRNLQASQGQTCTEAWFLGGHGNLGGSLAQDGLSLWPLQYLLSEAQAKGLVLGFQPVDFASILNPLEYTMPINAQSGGSDAAKMQQSISFRNGVVVDMWDLRDVFMLTSGFEPFVNVSKSKLGPLFEGERKISGLNTDPHEGGFDVIIHPSVYFHDDWSPLGLTYINDLSGRHEIREFRKSITIPWGELFWNQPFRQHIDLTLQNPRVLVCGGHGIGKTSLINLIAGAKISEENSRLTSTDHDIYSQLQASGSEFIFHDSQGWDNGSDTPYHKAQEFLKNCRSQPVFARQLHCIWYCMEATQSRINAIDRQFFSSVDFNGITLLVVFTKSDRLFGDCLTEAFRNYQTDNNLSESLDPLNISADIQSEIKQRRAVIYEARKAAHAQQVMAELGQKFKCVFISRERQHKVDVEELITLTRESRKSPTLRHIHNAAVKSHIQQIMPKACGKAAMLMPEKTVLPWKSTFISREDAQSRLKVAAEDVLLPLFGLQLAKDAHFKDLAEIFAAVDSKRNTTIKGLWTTLSFNRGADIATSLGMGAGMGALLTVLKFTGPVGWIAGGAVATSMRIATNLQQDKAILTELALLLLVLDRMMWFGFQEISREMAARAWIEALKSLPDIDQKIQKDLQFFAPDDCKAFLLEIVNKFKYVDEAS